MSEYLTCFKKYATFSGRARRKEYWMFYLFNMLITAVLWILAVTVSPYIGTVMGLYSLIIIIPGISVCVRRLHDLGKSGAWWFISFVPVIGGIWMLILMVSDSQPGPNMYGENPKGVPSYSVGGNTPPMPGGTTAGPNYNYNAGTPAVPQEEDQKTVRKTKEPVMLSKEESSYPRRNGKEGNVCPRCGTVVPYGIEVCQNCGNILQ